MSLVIILDKSTFQSLNIEETLLLHNYYRPNITPILTMEIMADLKKTLKSGKESSKRVQDFAKKLLPYSSAINMYHLELLYSDLLLGNVDIDFTPILGCSNVVKSESGKVGFHFRESPQEKALSRWRDGNFIESEKDLAKIWRDETKKDDLLLNLKKTIKSKIKIKKKFTSIIELNKFIDNLLSNISTQQELLMFILDEFGVSAEAASRIFFRWSQCSNKDVKTFSPYAFFCAKVKMLFDLSLRFDLVGTRSTNLLDLQYFYYLPFTQLFSSNDKFQKLLIPHLLGPRQEFIDGVELKKDLSKLVAYRETLTDSADIRRTQKEPPQIIDSLTYQLWNKYYDWPKKFVRSIKKETKETEEYNKKLMDEFINAAPVPNNTNVNIKDGVEFFVRQHMMKPTDFCVCGSGKQLQECCYSREKMKKHGG